EDPQKGAWREAAAWLDRHLEPGDALAFSSERGSVTETRHVRANWFWYARQAGVGPLLDVNVRQDPRAVARQLAETIAAANPSGRGGVPPAAGKDLDPGIWLIMWRDPDHPVGFNDAFSDGPLHGLEIDHIQVFYDLVVTRFDLSTSFGDPGNADRPGL
ncbi:MAG: hypothetical protein AAGL98_03695, partial [Planctomycetota bacterium]